MLGWKTRLAMSKASAPPVRVLSLSLHPPPHLFLAFGEATHYTQASQALQTTFCLKSNQGQGQRRVFAQRLSFFECPSEVPAPWPGVHTRWRGHSGHRLRDSNVPPSCTPSSRDPSGFLLSH